MRRLFPWVAVAVAVFAVWGVSRGDNPTTDVTDPKLPNIPGPFHPYNITGAVQGPLPQPHLGVRPGTDGDDLHATSRF